MPKGMTAGYVEVRVRMPKSKWWAFVDNLPQWAPFANIAGFDNLTPKLPPLKALPAPAPADQVPMAAIALRALEKGVRSDAEVKAAIAKARPDKDSRAIGQCIQALLHRGLVSRPRKGALKRKAA